MGCNCMHWFHIVLTLAVVAFTLICAVFDWRLRRIPNFLTAPMFVAGLLASVVYGGLAGLWSSLLGFGTGFGLLFVLMVIGGGGAGDVKMMGALGAWLGPWQTLLVFLASAVATVFLVCGVALYRAVVKDPAEKNKKGKRAARGEKNDPFRLGRIMPYALPAALGAWVVLAYAWKHNTLPFM